MLLRLRLDLGADGVIQGSWDLGLTSSAEHVVELVFLAGVSAENVG